MVLMVLLKVSRTTAEVMKLAGSTRPPRCVDRGRIPWPPLLPWAPFDSGTASLVRLGEHGETSDTLRPEFRPTCELFLLLGDCVERGGDFARHENQGATYRTLGYIAGVVGMNAEERRCWFETCKVLGLTQRHAGHIITRLQDRERSTA